VDLHYYETGDLEYYDPAAITTGGGALQITLSKQNTHGLQYQGGMLQSWNTFCFTGGYIEGDSNAFGLRFSS
jgi:beta-glucan synthesis-associated protein KRE6